jgi:hypothetical protein
VPDDTSTIWVDSSFTDTSEATEDVAVEIFPADAENIGNYSMPVVFSLEETTPTDTDVWHAYFHQVTSISGVNSVASEYYSYPLPLMDDVYISLVEFYSGSTISGTNSTEVKYTTGYNSVSGSLDKRIIFTGGKEYPDSFNFVHTFTNSAVISGVMSWWSNYTNFSGNLTVSGTPLPFHDRNLDYPTEFTQVSGHNNWGAIDRVVDISFAGWVPFILNYDVYCTSSGYKFGYGMEATTRSGSVDVHYLEAFASDLTTSGIGTDIYCALTDFGSLVGEATTISGRIGYITADFYSTILSNQYLGLDVDLYSLKISNFSLDEGEFTTASGSIYVDITDDECPVSVSGTYFLVDDQIVPVTFSAITDGYRMFYDPDDDFESLTGTTVFTVHAENECGKYLEEDYYLTFGYAVSYTNNIGLSTGIDYGFNNKVAVRVSAENYATCPQLDALGWEFESKEQFNNDLSASIVGRFYDGDYGDISAEIYPQSTAYFYGKEFVVIVNAKDFAGNEMEQLTLTYRIENKP